MKVQAWTYKEKCRDWYSRHFDHNDVKSQDFSRFFVRIMKISWFEILTLGKGRNFHVIMTRTVLRQHYEMIFGTLVKHMISFESDRLILNYQARNIIQLQINDQK